MTDSDDDRRLPTTSEMRAEARRMEQSGDVSGALGVYDDLLRRYERDGDAIDDLADVYRRVGDLRVELRQPSRAFAAYQQAGEHYARAGSAPEIKELFLRMINVVPAAGDVYVKYARRLLDHGHLDAAVNVLADFARKASVETVTEAVNAIGRGDGDRRTQILRIIETIEQDGESQNQAARAVMQELVQTSGTDVRTVRPPPAVPTRPPAPRLSTEPSPPVPGTPAVPSTPPSRSTPITSTRVWGGGRPQRSRPKGGAAPARFRREYLWGVAAVFVIIVVAVVMFPGGPGANTPEILPTPIASTATDTSDSAEAGPQDQQNPAPDPPASQPPPATASTNPSPQPAAQPASDPPPSSAPAAGTDSLESVTPIDAPIVVQDLTVRAVAPAEFRGLQGFRVVHMLDSVAEFIVESYPVDSTSAASYPLGTVIVSVVQPDTSVSIVRYDERYLVFASGVVPEDSMRVLLGRLGIRAGN